MDANQQDLVAQFCGVTGASPSSAQSALASTNWNLEEAVAFYFAAQDPQDNEQEQDEEDYEDENTARPTAATGRTLAGGPAPAAASSSSAPPNRVVNKPASKMRTLKDIQGASGGDDEDDDDEKGPDMFAGGEKSGLAVQNPDKPGDHFKNILNQAKQNRDRPPGDEAAGPPPRTAFTGRAQTLGGDDAPSQVLDDPRANQPVPGEHMPRVQRVLHLWADGFSIDDGDLHRFDDPANAQTLAQINQGRAPLSLLNVLPGQEVDLQLDPHKDQNFVPPKKTYKPFGGSGQRLGSPTPGPSVTTGVASSAAPQTSTPSTSSQAATMDVNEGEPTLTLQIRLGDGTRLQSRFNNSHTIGDVYAFVNRASPESTARSWALMTTFPSKELSDKGQSLEAAVGKRGGVVVQKWT